jgi:hypothetical protein
MRSPGRFLQPLDDAQLLHLPEDRGPAAVLEQLLGVRVRETLGARFAGLVGVRHVGDSFVSGRG